MNITDNLIRIKTAKTDIINSLKNKGVEIPDNTLINEIPTIIDNAEIGGGGDTPIQPDVPELTPKYEGATVFRINVPEDNYEFAINLCNNANSATYDVDWGDGSLESGLTTDEQHHTYTKKGIYDINVYNISKGINLGGYYSTDKVKIYYLFNNSNNDFWGGTYIVNNDCICTNILIGKGIINFNDNAFQGCSSLQSIFIPEGIVFIGNNVFQDCSSLQSIFIPEGVTSIGNSAFQGCSSLQSIVIPERVTTIKLYTFQGCSSLQSIVIPESVTKIENYAFSNCSSLQSIVIPESVTSIGSNVFQGCSSLQNIVIPEGVTSIGDGIFSNCSSLQSIVIPKSVTKIQPNNFSYCSSLQNIVIPDSVTSIGGGAFSNCLYLQSITCKALTAPTIQSYSFPTSGFKYLKRYLYVPKESTGYNEGYWKTYLLDKGWELRYIEDRVKTPTTLKLKTKNNFFHNLQAIGQANLIDYELVDNEYIYHFDDKITELIQYTFYNKVLEEIVIPEGVTSIGVNAFYQCTSLQNIVIPEGVISINNQAFYQCTSLQNIVIPEGVISIGNATFSYCSSLQSLIFSESVMSIGDSGIANCASLQYITCKAITAPTIQRNTFASIGQKVPSGTPKILRIPQGASGYEETTSEWYKQLISKGYKVEYIVPNTLNYTSYNGDIVTPYVQSFEGKNEIVSNVYENGKGTITFKEGLTEIYEGMYNKDVVSALTSIEIPNGVTKIGDYSFRSQNLTTLNVPNSVTYIGDSAFNACTNLTEITLGSGVETIGQWAFGGCTKIATITCMAMVAPTFNQSFLVVGSNVSGDKILRVPDGATGYDTWLSQLNGFELQYI